MPAPRVGRATAFAVSTAATLALTLAPAPARAQSGPPPPPPAEPPAAERDTLPPDYSPGLLARASRGPWYPTSTGAWLFDSAVRDGLRAHAAAGQQAAHTASTLLVWALIATPFVDAGVQVLALGGDLRAANDLELVNLEAFGLSMALAWASHMVLGRERPYARASGLSQRCALRANASLEDCRADRNASFLSGHAASAYAAAGLFCAQLAYIAEPHAALDAGLCGVAMAGATATALLRVVADRHYATDVLAGTALGLVAGVAVPVLLHFASQAPIPVGRTLSTAAQSHDPGAVFAGGFAGMVLGVAVPVATTLFHGSTPVSAALPRWAILPTALPGGLGLTVAVAAP